MTPAETRELLMSLVDLSEEAGKEILRSIIGRQFETDYGCEYDTGIITQIRWGDGRLYLICGSPSGEPQMWTPGSIFLFGWRDERMVRVDPRTGGPEKEFDEEYYYLHTFRLI